MGHKSKGEAKAANTLRRQRKAEKYAEDNKNNNEKDTKKVTADQGAQAAKLNSSDVGKKQPKQPVPVKSTSYVLDNQNQNNSQGSKGDGASKNDNTKNTKHEEPSIMPERTMPEPCKTLEQIGKRPEEVGALKKFYEDAMQTRHRNGSAELPEGLIKVIGDVEKMKPFYIPTGVGTLKTSRHGRRLSDGATALHLAVKAKSPAAVTYLLLHGDADPQEVDYMGDNVIMCAIKEGDTSYINKIWPYKRELDVNHANIFGYTALHLATDRGWEGCVSFLLQNGADVNSVSTGGLTPLMFAASRGEVKIVERLIKAGADIMHVDRDSNTCVTKAFLEKHQAVVDYILCCIDDDKKERYIQTILDMAIVHHLPRGLNHLLSTKFFPLLEECTKHKAYRQSFYTKNIVYRAILEMQKQKQCGDTVILAAQLIFCIFFRFNKSAIDKGFVYQFLECKGPDSVIHIVTNYTEVLSISDKCKIFAFLPMIGLSEIPEGRTWLERNYLAVAEYISGFDRNGLKVLISHNSGYHWCLEVERFPLINKIWKHFYDIIKTYETERKEKHIKELLEYEEHEQFMKLNKGQRKKGNSEQVPGGLKPPAAKSNLELVFGEPLFGLDDDESEDDMAARNTAAGRDLQMIADMFRYVPSPIKPVVSSEHTTFDSDVAKTGRTIPVNPWKVQTTRSRHSWNVNFNSENKGTQLTKPKYPRAHDDWTTVHTKKQANKDRARTDKPEFSTSTPRSNVDTRPRGRSRQRRRKQRNSPTVTHMQKHAPAAGHNTGPARWADVAKVPLKQYPETQVSRRKAPVTVLLSPPKNAFVEKDFPSLGTSTDVSSIGSPLQRNQPSKMTFHFQESELSSNSLDTSTDDTSAAVSTEVGELQGLQTPRLEETTPSEQPGDDETADEYYLSEPDHTESDISSSALPNQLAYQTNQTAEMKQDDSPYKGEIWSQQMPGVGNDITESEREEQVDAWNPNFQEETEEERNISKHQRESIITFLEEVVSQRANDPFISLEPSTETVDIPLQKDGTSAVDALFETQEEIPQWFEEDSNEVTENDRYWMEASNGGHRTESPPEMDSKHVAAQHELAAHDPAIIGYLNNPGQSDTNNRKRRPMARVTTRNEPSHVPDVRDMPSNVQPECVMSPQIQPIEQPSMNQPVKDLDISMVNSAFGQTLLENACNTDEPGEDESPIPPDTLDGVPFTNDTETPIIDNSFPSFHETTKLSADLDKDDEPATTKMQKLHMETVYMFYRHNKPQIMLNGSAAQEKFIYYAQIAGMTVQAIQQCLNGQFKGKNEQPREVKVTSISSRQHCPLPYRRVPLTRNNQAIPLPDSPNVQYGLANKPLHKEVKPVARNPNVPNQYGTHESQPIYQPQQMSQKQAFQQKPNQMVHNTPQQKQPLFVLNIPATGQTSFPQGQQPQNLDKRMPAAQVNTHQHVPQTMQVPLTAMPPSDTRLLHAQQAEMTSSVNNQLNEIYTSMVEAKIRSIRWKQELANIRAIPNEQLLIIGKIVIPKAELCRFYLANHSTGPTILGYLLDGLEVSVKILDRSRKTFHPEELERLRSMDVSNYFISKYKEFSFHENCYFLAMELHETTLIEYLRDLKVDDRIRKTRMVFQILRGLSSLHQQYLMVHGELRPENIVVDLDGNMKLTGYGIGRNTDRDMPFIEYSTDDKCWLAPEQLVQKLKISFKSDIFVAGMLIYFILKNGQHVFGDVSGQIIRNISTMTYNMDPNIDEEAKDLLKSMLSIHRTERPCISDALRHPMFWADEKRLRFISIVGSDIVYELKQAYTDCSKRDSMIEVITCAQCTPRLTKWMDTIDPALLRDMCTYRQYKGTLAELVLFIHNYCSHTDKLSENSRRLVDEPCTYFLTRFPTLFMTVYRTIKISGKKDKTCYKPFF